MNAITRLGQPYKDAEEQRKAELAQAKADALGDVPVVGKGSLTFEQVDKFLSENPDADFFRIANKSAIDLEPKRGYGLRTPQLEVGQASIVSKSGERNTLNRYANISALERRGNEFADIPVDIRYKSSSFFSGQEYQYDANDGLIFSRDEYGNLKELAKRKGRKDGFLVATEKEPELPSDYLEDASNTDNIERTEFRGLGAEDDSDVASQTTKGKRTLLG